MARHTLDSTWSTIGGPGDALTIRNISAEDVDLIFAVAAPPADLGDPVDLWTLSASEGASVRGNQSGLTLWARSSSGASIEVDVFTYLAVVSGEGFYELAPLADGASIELLSGGVFDETTGAHWTQSPGNGATVTHAADGLTMTPASTAFADRAQVFQAFPSKSGRTYTVKVVADQVPSSDSCLCLIYDADGGLTLIDSQSITAAGESTFDFVAAGTVSEIHLRVHNTTASARFLSASVNGVP